MQIQKFLLILSGIEFFLISPLIFSFSTPQICVTNCPENFTILSRINDFSIVKDRFFLDDKNLLISVEQTLPDGKYTILKFDFNRSYEIIQLNNDILAIDNRLINANLILQNTYFYVPYPLELFADPNSIFEIKCWATRNNPTMDLISTRPNNKFSDVLFLNSDKSYFCGEIKEIQ